MPKQFIVCGLSHHSTPVALRERLAADGERAAQDLRTLMDQARLDEAVLLSTCNRVELIGTTAEPGQARERVTRYFNERAAPERVDSYLYEHQGLDAVRHLFEVAAGLDSMVLGEPQILGQVKDAYGAANDAGAVGTLLSRCFDRTFSVAKRVRTETEIAAGNVSVSSIACEVAEHIFGNLSGRRVLLVGAGKMSEAASRSLTARGAELTVVNRNPERAQALAEACGGRPRPLEALATELAEADVVISSTAKQGYIITHELMQGVVKMRKFRQLFLIDIAVPRDIDPRVDSLRNVFLYNMDDLKQVSEANLAARERAKSAALSIIDQETAHYDRWLQSLEVTPTIVALRERVREVVLRERDKALPKLSGLDAKQQKALDAMCQSIVNQLLHGPLTELKQGQGEPDGQRLVEAAQRLFSLAPGADEEGEPQQPDAAMTPATNRGRRS